MECKVRKTAIDVVGDVPWGTHFCQFYQTKEDLVDILVPYFRAGLKDNEFCMWVTSEPLNVEDAKKALKKKVKDLDDYIKKGQIEILDYSQWYTKSGHFDSDTVLQGWVEKEKQALEKGFEGLRLTGNTFWLEEEDWEDFANYEAAVNSVIGQYRMLAVCTYCLDKCTASEIIDVVSNHQFALIERKGKWEIIESAEHRKTVEALRLSEADYHAIFDSAKDAIFVHDIESGKILSVNRKACEMFGYAREEMEKLTVEDLSINVPPYDQDHVMEWIKKATEKGPQLLEWIAQHKTGRTFWIEVNLKFAVIAGKDRILAIVRDITERKQAQKALEESEDKYRAIFAQAADSIVLIAPENGTLVEFNDRAHESLGYTREEFQKLKIPDFEIIESAKEVIKHIKKIVREGADTFETKHRTKDGIIRDVLVSSRAISIGGREFVQSIWRDITEGKKAEESLKLHDIRLQALLDLNKMAGASEQEILDFVREKAVDVTQSKFAFIGFMNEDESVQTTYAWSKEVMRQCAIVETPRQFPIAEAGLWGEVVRQRRPIIINDYAAPHPHKKGYPKGHVPIERFLCVPVFDGERIVVVAAVANKEKDYDESDVRALTSMFNDMWRLIQRKQAEEQIENLARFPSEDPFPVLRIAKDGTVLYANSAGSELLRDWGCEVGSHAPEYWCQYVLRILKSESSKELEVACRDRIFSVIMAPVVDAKYVNIYGTDITGRKQAEENLRKYRQHLEELVQGRTEELTEANKQLLQEIGRGKQLERAILNVSEREQRRIGRELHDSIGQQFTGIAFMTKVLEQKLATKLPEEAASVEEIRKLVNQAMDQTRGLVKVLEPVTLDAGSLMLALREFSATTEHLFGIHCTFKCDKPVPIDDAEVAVHLYRIAQEAVTNAIKHGQAKNIHIGLTYGKKESVLTVKSDGVNFPKEFEKRGTGMGLQIMDHRADIIGGSLDIHSGPTGGTIVTCAFPNKKHKQ